jgi:uroporphyrin-III C-methyltransferase
MSRGLWGKSLNQLALKRENIIRALSKYSDKKEVMGELVRQSFKKIRKMEKSTGKVFLVGAGPGDPELITAKGLRAIQTADVILHDALIHPHLVFEINPLAQKIFVGKREDKHSVSQESIHSIMVEEAAKGKMVVRLKGGDPFMFGRGGEEVLALAESNIPFEVIPGITAGLGAAAGFGIPLTHRDDATSTLFITGHQCRNKVSQDWKILAKLNTTLVFYMGTKRLTEIVMGLVENGKSKDTPIAIVQNATMLIQNISTSTLGSILKDIKYKKPMTPAVIIIGNVVNYHSKIQKCLDALPSEIVAPIEDMGFDIWKNKAVVA